MVSAGGGRVHYTLRRQTVQAISVRTVLVRRLVAHQTPANRTLRSTINARFARQIHHTFHTKAPSFPGPGPPTPDFITLDDPPRVPKRSWLTPPRLFYNPF